MSGAASGAMGNSCQHVSAGLEATSATKWLDRRASAASDTTGSLTALVHSFPSTDLTSNLPTSEMMLRRGIHVKFFLGEPGVAAS
jgi:hypothetical protein